MEQGQITFHSGEHTFCVCSTSMSRNSDYFRALLDSGMQETITRNVSLPEFDKTALDIVVSFVKTESLGEVEEDEIESLLEIASYLQMPKLMSDITSRVLDKLSVENCIQNRELGRQFHNDTLRCSSDSFLARHAADYFQTEDFTKMTCSEAFELLDRDDLWICDEHTIFEAAVKWISGNEQTDRNDQRKLLSTVRFPLIHQVTLTSACVDTLKAMHLLDLCEDFVDEATLFHKNGCVYCGTEKKFTPRRLMPCVLAVGGFTGKEHSTNRLQVIPSARLQQHTHVQFENLRKSRGHSSEDVSSARYECRRFHVSKLDNVEVKVNIAKMEDTPETEFSDLIGLHVWPMQTPRSLFFMCAMNGMLYAVGGWTAPDTVTRRVEFYNPVENKWTYVSSLSIGLHEHAGCVVNETMYISGGYKGPYRGHLDNLWSYCADTDTWREHRSMNHARSYHTMVACDTNLIVCGGVNYIPSVDTFEDVKDCEVYNVGTDEWTTVSQTLRCTSCSSAIQLGDSLYIFGGHSFEDESDHNCTQILNTKTFTWQESTFKAHNILYFASISFPIPEIFVECDKKS